MTDHARVARQGVGRQGRRRAEHRTGLSGHGHPRLALTDCATILDMRIERGSVHRDVVEPTRALALALLDELLPLIIEPPKGW